MAAAASGIPDVSVNNEQAQSAAAQVQQRPVPTPVRARSSVFPPELRMYDSLLAALHELSCTNPIQVDAFLAGLWDPRERQNLFCWLKRVLDQADVPISVFFKTTQLFDRFVEQDVLETMATLGKNGMNLKQGIPCNSNSKEVHSSNSTASLSTVATGSVSTVASSPQTPLDPAIKSSDPSCVLENQSGANWSGYHAPCTLSRVHTDVASQLLSVDRASGKRKQNFYAHTGWTLPQTRRIVLLACCSLVMKIDFRKHYTKHFDALMQAAGPLVFGSGCKMQQLQGSQPDQPCAGYGVPMENNGDYLASGDQQNSTSSMQHGQGKESITNSAIGQCHPYAFSLFSGKSFVQSVEWPIVKVLKFKLSVPCIIDFLDYFDTHCQIRSRKTSAIDVILYHPELLYANKMTSVALAVWFLSHKNQDHVHAILQKMQSFECFTTSKQLLEMQKNAEQSGAGVPFQRNENSITTADLRRLVTQLRDAFKACSTAMQNQQTGEMNNAPNPAQQQPAPMPVQDSRAPVMPTHQQVQPAQNSDWEQQHPQTMPMHQHAAGSQNNIPVVQNSSNGPMPHSVGVDMSNVAATSNMGNMQMNNSRGPGPARMPPVVAGQMGPGSAVAPGPAAQNANVVVQSHHQQCGPGGERSMQNQVNGEAINHVGGRIDKDVLMGTGEQKQERRWERNYPEYHSNVVHNDKCEYPYYQPTAEEYNMCTMNPMMAQQMGMHAAHPSAQMNHQQHVMGYHNPQMQTSVTSVSGISIPPHSTVGGPGAGVNAPAHIRYNTNMQPPVAQNAFAGQAMPSMANQMAGRTCSVPQKGPREMGADITMIPSHAANGHGAGELPQKSISADSSMCGVQNSAMGSHDGHRHVNGGKGMHKDANSRFSSGPIGTAENGGGGGSAAIYNRNVNAGQWKKRAATMDNGSSQGLKRNAYGGASFNVP